MPSGRCKRATQSGIIGTYTVWYRAWEQEVEAKKVVPSMGAGDGREPMAQPATRYER